MNKGCWHDPAVGGVRGGGGAAGPAVPGGTERAGQAADGGEARHGGQAGSLHRSVPAHWRGTDTVTDGGIHAREWISPAVVTSLLRQFIDRPPPALQNMDFYFLPLLVSCRSSYTLLLAC